MPVRDVLVFNDYAEDTVEEFSEMIKNSVARGVAEVLNEIDFK